MYTIRDYSKKYPVDEQIVKLYGNINVLDFKGEEYITPRNIAKKYPHINRREHGTVLVNIIRIAIRMKIMESEQLAQKQFRSLLAMAKTFQEVDPDRADFWRGFQRGLRRLYHGEKFGTLQEHEQWLNCRDGEYRKQLQDGYRTGFAGKNPLNKEAP